MSDKIIYSNSERHDSRLRLDIYNSVARHMYSSDPQDVLKEAKRVAKWVVGE